LKDDGSVEFSDENDQPLAPRHRKLIVDQMGEGLTHWLQQQCDLWNKGIKQILRLHLDTPSPFIPASLVRSIFPVPEPLPPEHEENGIIGLFSAKRRQQVAHTNAEKQQRYEAIHRAWQDQKESYEKEQDEYESAFQRAQLGDIASMEKVLERHLGSITWPRETLACFEIDSHGKSIFLDVDLPEIEDLPMQEARLAKNGLKILVKDRSESQRRREYMQHVHAVGFRLAGEVFHLLPGIDLLTVSGYSQRADKATGHTRDDYLFSVQVSRGKWEALNFTDLASLDPVDCLGTMEIKRDMSKTGVFKPIEPFAISQS
jgi:hypothetical protein